MNNFKRIMAATVAATLTCNLALSSLCFADDPAPQAANPAGMPVPAGVPAADPAADAQPVPPAPPAPAAPPVIDPAAPPAVDPAADAVVPPVQAPANVLGSPACQALSGKSIDDLQRLRSQVDGSTYVNGETAKGAAYGVGLGLVAGLAFAWIFPPVGAILSCMAVGGGLLSYFFHSNANARATAADQQPATQAELACIDAHLNSGGAPVAGPNVLNGMPGVSQNMAAKSQASQSFNSSSSQSGSSASGMSLLDEVRQANSNNGGR